MLKPERSFLLINAPDGYETKLGPLPERVTLITQPGEPVDVAQVFVASRQELEAHLPQLKPLIKPGGMLWVTYQKGTSNTKTDINRDSIAAYARSTGMEGIAIISVDHDWSALRLKVV